MSVYDSCGKFKAVRNNVVMRAEGLILSTEQIYKLYGYSQLGCTVRVRQYTDILVIPHAI